MMIQKVSTNIATAAAFSSSSYHSLYTSAAVTASFSAAASFSSSSATTESSLVSYYIRPPKDLSTAAVSSLPRAVAIFKGVTPLLSAWFTSAWRDARTFTMSL